MSSGDIHDRGQWSPARLHGNQSSYAHLSREHHKEGHCLNRRRFGIDNRRTFDSASRTVCRTCANLIGGGAASSTESVVTFSESGGLVLNAPRGAVPSRTSQTAGLSNVMGGIILVPPRTVRHGGVTQTLLHTSIWLDEFATSILVKGLFAGSGAAWVAAEVTSWTGVGGLSGGAIAAILALGGALIALRDLNGRGIVLLSGIIPPSGCLPR
jgi:hypothetical protein